MKQNAMHNTFPQHISRAGSLFLCFICGRHCEYTENGISTHFITMVVQEKQAKIALWKAEGCKHVIRSPT